MKDYNHGDFAKLGFQRATRTDRRVHALLNCFSLRVQIPKDLTCEEFRRHINEEVPNDMRVFAVLDVPWSFNAKHHTSHREYSYYLPTFMLSSMRYVYLGHPIEEILK